VGVEAQVHGRSSAEGGMKRSVAAAQADREQASPVEVELAGLYRAEAPRLLRLFGQRVGPERAPDLVQESFARLAARRAGHPPISSPAGYLVRIAVNLLRNPQEAKRRRAQDQQLAFDDLSHGAVDPHARLEARDMLQRLDKAVLRLKPKTRMIFIAHRVEGLSYAQIAERTGLSIKGVEKQISKALADLDRLIHR
jgi:RNA polymerase sigma factor (sigma-70 family)